MSYRAILPVLQSFSDSGYRSTRSRLLQALRENARYQATILGVGTVFLIYMVITSGLSLGSLSALVIALAHSYALMLAIYLMGHGLVSLPRKLLRAASVSGSLHSLQVSAVTTYDQLTDATTKLLEVQSEVRLLIQRKHTLPAEFAEWVGELGEIVALPESNLSPRERTMLSYSTTSAQTPSLPTVITEEYLASITRKLRKSLDRRTRYLTLWQNLLQSANDCQQILDSSSSRSLEPFRKVVILSKPASLFPDSITVLTPYTRHLLYMYGIPSLQRFLGLLLGLASIVLIWSEVVSSFAPRLSIVAYTISWGAGGVLQQSITAAWISYMAITSLLSLSSVRLWNGYALVPRKTSGASACFYASYAARLTVPLSFNFLTLLPSEKLHTHDTVFFEFLGNKINLTPLGSLWNKFLPALILIPVFATLFDWYGRIAGCCGLGEYLGWADGDGDSGEEEDGAINSRFRGGWVWQEGRDLINRELSQGGGALTGYVRGIQENSRSDSGRHRSTNFGSTGRIDDTAEDEDESEERGLLGNFASRVRNTIETQVGSFTPRWMTSGQTRRAENIRLGQTWQARRPAWYRMLTGVGSERNNTV